MFHFQSVRYFVDESISCLVEQMAENGEKVALWCFPNALALNCLVLSTTQRSSVHCHRGVKKPEDI